MIGIGRKVWARTGLVGSGVERQDWLGRDRQGVFGNGLAGVDGLGTARSGLAGKEGLGR